MFQLKGVTENGLSELSLGNTVRPYKASDLAKELCRTITSKYEPMTDNQSYIYNQGWAFLRGYAESLLTLIQDELVCKSPKDYPIVGYGNIGIEKEIVCFNLAYHPAGINTPEHIIFKKLSEIPLITEDWQTMDLYIRHNFPTDYEWDEYYAERMPEVDKNKRLALDYSRLSTELVYYPEQPEASKFILSIQPQCGLKSNFYLQAFFYNTHMWLKFDNGSVIGMDSVGQAQFEVFRTVSADIGGLAGILIEHMQNDR